MEINEIINAHEIRHDDVAFADQVLGVWPHPGQQKWLRESHRLMNFLRPGNRWGKTMSDAIRHIRHGVCKPLLEGKVQTEDEWMRVPYDTLILGPEYEQAREFLRLISDITEGRLLIPVCPVCDSHKITKDTARSKEFTCLHCKTKFINPNSRPNNSLLKGWAIEDDKSSSQLLPSIIWFNKAQCLGRSASDMGKALKMKALALVTGDEISDVSDLYVLTTNTLLPRLVSFRGSIDFIGTPQPNGFDYQRMIETAEQDMKRDDWDTKGLYYVQKGSMYDNIYLDSDYIKQIESVADPDLRRQIIEGDFVNVGEKFFGYDRVKNMIDSELKQIDEGVPGRSYIISVDFAAGDSAWADYTVMMVFDYTEEPWKLVHFERFKAKDIPIPLQYEKIRDTTYKFRGRLIIDSGGPGGKNAAAFLKDTHPINFDGGPTGNHGSKKGEGLANLKGAMEGVGSETLKRRNIITDDGVKKELNPKWGLIRIPNIPEIINELTSYALDDKKLRTDCVMCMMMGIDWLVARRPKQSRNKAVSLDFLEARVDESIHAEEMFPYNRRNRAGDY